MSTPHRGKNGRFLPDTKGMTARSSAGRAAGFQTRSVVGSIPTVPFRLFRWLWRDYLYEDEKIVKITGWRSCVVDRRSGQRERVTFMPIATFREKRRIKKMT